MESDSHKFGVRTGGAGACFFLDVRAAGLEDRFAGVVFFPFGLLLGGDLGFLTGMDYLTWVGGKRGKIIAQMVCFL